MWGTKVCSKQGELLDWGKKKQNRRSKKKKKKKKKKQRQKLTWLEIVCQIKGMSEKCLKISILSFY